MLLEQERGPHPANLAGHGGGLTARVMCTLGSCAPGGRHCGWDRAGRAAGAGLTLGVRGGCSWRPEAQAWTGSGEVDPRPREGWPQACP